ncbi:hypothetical protein VNI00_012899 [Paramarasmius palmivorus]|uniref:Uncharacterized protein n=1 Tax=Paramarasmius palmivorus TaxID=297713 RepID=A0AAW0C008_9AGAR
MGATTSAIPPPVVPVAQPVTNVAPAAAPVVEQRVVTPIGGHGTPLPDAGIAMSAPRQYVGTAPCMALSAEDTLHMALPP